MYKPDDYFMFVAIEIQSHLYDVMWMITTVQLVETLLKKNVTWGWQSGVAIKVEEWKLYQNEEKQTSIETIP